MGLADLGEAAAAGSASEKAREKVTRSASTLGADAVVVGRDARSGVPLAFLDQVPEIVVDDAKVRHLLDDPFCFRVEPGLALSGMRIFDKLLAVPDQSADIKLVVEDPRAASPIAVNRGRSPGLTGWTGDSLLV